MTDIGKWNYETKTYDPYTPDWEITFTTADMELPINCTGCGKQVTFGECYTSQELHTSIGFGYPVCDECYEVECEKRKASK